MGGGCNSVKMGLRGILVCYFVKIETVFGCRNSNNLSIHQDFFFYNATFEKKKTQGAGLCDFKPTLGMQIRRNGMGYVSKKKK